MAHDVALTMNAIRSHETICQSLADLDVDAAIAHDTVIYEKLAQLAYFPYISAEYELRGKPTPFREVQVGNYRVFYEIKERRSRVSVALIWHSARDEPTLEDLRGR